MQFRSLLPPAALLLLLLTALSGRVSAQVPPDGGFSKPLDCTLDRDCWIVNVPDAGVDPKVEDHRCGNRTYEDHKGTDFAIRDYRAMDEGVPVLAAAPGIVTAARDGTADYFLQTPETRKLIGSKACGNGVIVEHDGGWESQYCHMRKDSIAVALGQRVGRGERLGLVGMSGRTEFPHVHVEFRAGGAAVNPFTGGPLKAGCDQAERPIWHPDAGVRYPAFALYAAGFADHVPKTAEISSSARSPVAMTRHQSALVLWAAMFGVVSGDVVRLRILDPAGKALAVREIRLTRSQARRMEAVGRELPAEGWAPGEWKGEAELERFVAGRTISRRIVVPLIVR
ncbi:MAG: M23 family metallopeptidase [Rhodospirillaceae bacterium]